MYIFDLKNNKAIDLNIFGKQLITKGNYKLINMTNNYRRKHGLPARRSNTIRKWNKNENRIIR